MGLPICVKCLLGSMIGEENFLEIESLIFDSRCWKLSLQFSSAMSLSSSSSKARAQGSSPSTSSMVASQIRSHIDRFLGSLEIGYQFVCFVSREGVPWQWWANIIKWTQTNIRIYLDATLCTERIFEYIRMPHIYQTNIRIYLYARNSTNTNTNNIWG